MNHLYIVFLTCTNIFGSALARTFKQIHLLPQHEDVRPRVSVYASI